ncbi:hypothetical protein ANFP_14470 [Acidithiobacillus ferrooxidans]|nr:hypothetical protein ANFP_14470 [Acidithiobacillus ferrooxidans]
MEAQNSLGYMRYIYGRGGRMFGQCVGIADIRSSDWLVVRNVPYILSSTHPHGSYVQAAGVYQ